MAAIYGIGAVVEDAVDEIPGRGLGDGDEAAEIHQQTAVAVENDHLAVGAAEREA
jgi:hypothetical protein